jgi:hypothetical protein
MGVAVARRAQAVTRPRLRLLLGALAREQILFVAQASRSYNEINVEQGSSLDISSRCVFRGYPPVLPHDVEKAALLASRLAAVPRGGAWRIFRALSVYVKARSETQLLDRLHQYRRCIDGLILSELGSGTKQFKSRTELFIGPRHHDLMGELYDLRSDVEQHYQACDTSGRPRYPATS